MKFLILFPVLIFSFGSSMVENAYGRSRNQNVPGAAYFLQDEEDEDEAEESEVEPPSYRSNGGEVSPSGFAGRDCTNTGDELFCMVCNIYFESGFEPYVGQVQVGRTVMERKKIGRWGRSACSVIWANKQFSWTWINNNTTLPNGGNALSSSIRAAQQAMREGPNGASHYFNDSLVNPSWAKNCERAPIYEQYSQEQIGQHLFLTCPNYFFGFSNDLGTPWEQAEHYMTSGSFYRVGKEGMALRSFQGEALLRQDYFAPLR